MRFSQRHISLTDAQAQSILQLFGKDNLQSWLGEVIPKNIARTTPLDLPNALSEEEALTELKKIACLNKIEKTYIGQGYYYSHLPTVIARNILENPAWYTAYTPYQPEISQGRLEAIMNFQQMLIDLTKMDIANASMLDEGTAAAEAMTLIKRVDNTTSDKFFVLDGVFKQTIEVLQTRAKPLNIDICIGRFEDFLQAPEHTYFGLLIQYPNCYGEVLDLERMIQHAKNKQTKVVVASDVLALSYLKAPGDCGADIVVGNTQRFGVPVGFGGPHAAFLATKDAYKRSMPGRIVGLSIDAQQRPAYRLALQTREQHIRREKATSNICTAQVLLAVIASMYALYHGAEGVHEIADQVHQKTSTLAKQIQNLGYTLKVVNFFDTLSFEANVDLLQFLAQKQLHIYQHDLLENNQALFSLTLDETTTAENLTDLVDALKQYALQNTANQLSAHINHTSFILPVQFKREIDYFQHPNFKQYHSEHEMLRYLRRLADKDLALDRTMIPLGSCTMKLNSTSEMMPITWPEFNQIHPLSPKQLTAGYQVMIEQLCHALSIATGYDAVSLQPNAGSQGEYAGLLIIQAYHQARNEGHRNICLIPQSAHGTNPASAQMVGMQIVIVNCDAQGNIDLADLTQKAEQHSQNLAAIMITYPSTHGVFEAEVDKVCQIIHQHGGQVYIDGANMNALVGTASPGHFGGDCSHLNLHKTFCIPHGGGGPGVGPIAVKAHLADFLPKDAMQIYPNSKHAVGAVSSASFGSASILPIPWMYIAMMGFDGLTKATEFAILAANYIAFKLKDHYPILYTGEQGWIAHECIIDIRPLQKTTGISNEDIAKRLIDYGFHAPTMSFPVAGTLMIEPTESESLAELDRFIDALIAIKQEIDCIEQGIWDKTHNPLKQAPHTADVLMQAQWPHAYTRLQAAYGIHQTVNKSSKYWPPVGRVDNVYGDRNLCTCLPIEAYAN